MTSRVSPCLFTGFGLNIIVLFLWTISSFLCHYTGKQFLTQVNAISSERVAAIAFFSKELVHATILTGIQLAFCSTCVKIKESPSPVFGYILKICHALASLATNLSMANMFASSTFAIKMMEPITSAIMQRIILGRPMTALSILSLPFIVGGAIVFSSGPQLSSVISIGVLMALASNILLSLRNIAIKQSSAVQSEGDFLAFRTKRQELAVPLSFLFMSMCLVLKLGISDVLPPKTTEVVVLAMSSALFHVAYSYISTGIVLKYMSVVSHAVSNIVKRVLVVLCLYSFGQRQASGFNFLGLLVCTIGLIFYTLDKTQKNKSAEKQSSDFICTRKGVTLIFVSASIITIVALSYTPCTLDKSYIRGVAESNCSYTSTSDTHYFRNTFDYNGLSKPTEEELHQVPNISAQLSSFLKRRLIETPHDANLLSRELTNVDSIIRESQRLHFNIFGDALKKFKYAMIFDIASFENKGDPCITVGEMYFLRRMNIEILYYCNFHACVDKNLDKAKELAQHYGPEQLVILVHGGGNIIGYASNDFIRFKLLERFPTFQMFVFPQSIWIRNMKNPHVKRTIDHYCCHPNLTLVLRDQLSYETAKKIYNGTSRLLMAPDMAFQIGRVGRFMSPVFDILWLKRADGETPGYQPVKKVPKHLRVHISDWWKWLTPAAGSNLEKAFYISVNGFFFLQRGRVIITDRLHGHILSTLMDIPHVLIDNKAKKLSSYHYTWTKSLHNTVITDKPDEALDLAIGLLEKFNETLPPVAPFLSVSEYFTQPRLGVPIVGYP